IKERTTECMFGFRFKPAVVKECIREVVRERLTGVRYDDEEVRQLSTTLADSIKDRVKSKWVYQNASYNSHPKNLSPHILVSEAGFDRYKLTVQVVIGEQRGQGVKMSTRCFWDADTDSYAEDVFITENLFCVVVVFGSYYY
ncbi:hypothetical protein NQD34_002622, partial [Periophthalmus magnuspinnatus]